MDQKWKAALREAAVSGSLASVCSAGALALAGRRESNGPAAPINATSQWVWGQREALGADRPDRRHTVIGYLVHHFAASFWAVLHARALADRPIASRPAPALAAAATTAALAAVVDLKFTPERFTPGFQHRVSTPALVAVYACFALGLGLGSLAVRNARR
jgi:hypothetical protein